MITCFLPVYQYPGSLVHRPEVEQDPVSRSRISNGDFFFIHKLIRYFSVPAGQRGLRRIRYHDLRHSCASLLLANGVPMKQIQEWLGHSDFSTTANVYAHLDYNSKLSSADAMVNGLQGALSVIS